MAHKIQIKRGNKADLPTLDAGEFGLCQDTNELFIGNSGNQKIFPPTAPTISDVEGLQTALDNKVDNSRVLTNVPVNAKFTDTTYSEISTSEIDAGTSSTLRTITGRRVKYLLDKVQGWINALTKSDIGLGDVENYSIATQSEAESGTVNNRYMTPLRTKQAINTHNIYESSHQDIRQQINDLDAEVVAHKADGASHSKTARFVVGTSTSGWTEKDCDYLCDGTADDVEINAAITALPATGGEVVILDGTYNITATINVNKDNVSIRGNGNATILKRGWDSSFVEGVITLTEVEGCRVENLQIDGNKAAYSLGNNHGIRLDSSDNNTVTGNIINNNNSNGIRLDSSDNNTVTGNIINNNNNNGISLSSSGNNILTDNTCNNNNRGIYFDSSSDNTVTGNTCNNNNNNGIRLSSSSNNTVTGNTCNNNNSNGIRLSSSSNNTVTGNTCIRGTGQTSDYASDQYTIRLQGISNNYNLISSNNCMGKAPVVGGGTGNTLVNNKWDAA